MNHLISQEQRKLQHQEFHRNQIWPVINQLHKILNVEKGCFTPIVFNTTGGMAKETDKFLKKLAEKLACKRSTPYSKMASFVRKRLRFDLTKTILIALRGYRGKPSSEAAPLKDLDIHLEKTDKVF